MVVLITGASHTGKTALAQRILHKYGFTYLSVDHLKMGLIRSGCTALTPLSDDDDLTAYLWPILREMIKTAIENKQNLTVEGCYIPFDWQKDFEKQYLDCIKCYCLVMTEHYITNYFADIKAYENVIEQRSTDDDFSLETALKENARFFRLAKNHGVNCILINDGYEINLEL